MARSKLTQRERGYCYSFIELQSQIAAFRANYSHKNMKDATCHRNAAALHARPHVQAFIAELQDKQRERHHVTVDRIIEEYSILAFSDIRHMFGKGGERMKPHELPSDIAKALTSIDLDDDGYIIRFRVADKRPSLGDLGKHKNMFKEDITIKAEVTQKTVTDLEFARRLAFLLSRGVDDVSS